ncbi:AraC family transcriptional regulator [Amycolatopsis sp. NBC_00438]|uniref:AraC family transcriptional regulator n=1 Tax=Amycolatopsis sp. NBC_00438 TaxID=2903558 RepID=UPI002E1CC9D1
MDVLSEVLAAAGITASSGLRIVAGGDWGMMRPEWTDAALYGVVSGEGVLLTREDGLRPFAAGDVLLLTSGIAHVIASSPSAEAAICDGRAVAEAQHSGDFMTLGTGDATVQLVAASYSRDMIAPLPWLQQLPEVIHIRAETTDARTVTTLHLLDLELTEPGAGSRVIIDRLVDVLLACALRSWANGETDCESSLWRTLRDPAVVSAVAAIHRDPSHAWTAATLAKEAAVSRTTLNRRFEAATGDGPATYLTRWRMHLAARRLRDSDDTVEHIAAESGYTSVAAFSRAFRRELNTPPAQFRRDSRVT